MSGDARVGGRVSRPPTQLWSVRVGVAQGFMSNPTWQYGPYPTLFRALMLTM